MSDERCPDELIEKYKALEISRRKLEIMKLDTDAQRREVKQLELDVFMFIGEDASPGLFNPEEKDEAPF